MFLPVPPRLDEAGFERLLERAVGNDSVSTRGLDLEKVSFIDPFGLLGLLSIGASSSYRKTQAWGLMLPRDSGVSSFLERCGALALLEKLFVLAGEGGAETGEEPRGAESGTLLEITPIRGPADVHRAVARVKGRADLLLVSRLGYNTLAADRFTVAVAEICQNIVDHSGSEGFVAAQFYPPSKGRGMVRLAVSDVGIGVRRSLAGLYASRGRSTWNDREAVRLAFRRGVSGSGEPGRGLGLKLVAEMVRGWGGRLLLRSGTAAYAICPAWGPRPRRSGLAPFPGTQINLFLPVREE